MSSLQTKSIHSQILGTGGIVLAHDEPFACSSGSLSCMAVTFDAGGGAGVGFYNQAVTASEKPSHFG